LAVFGIFALHGQQNIQKKLKFDKEGYIPRTPIMYGWVLLVILPVLQRLGDAYGFLVVH